MFLYQKKNQQQILLMSSMPFHGDVSGTLVGSYSQFPRLEMRSYLNLTKKTFFPFIFSFSLWSFVRDINKTMDAHDVARLTLGTGKTYIPANQKNTPHHPVSLLATSLERKKQTVPPSTSRM